MISRIKKLRPWLRKRRLGRKGQTLVEYALVTAFVSVVMVLTFTLLNKEIVIVFSKVANTLDTAQSSH